MIIDSLCRSRPFVRALWLALPLATGAYPVLGQNYPARAVRFVVPYLPGGGADFVARTVALKLTETWGQSVVVDNRPGGGTNIAAELVVRAAPDGYTVFVGGMPNAVNVSLYKQLPFDLMKDFVPVVQLSTIPNILVVHPSLPVRSVKELIALAKSRRGELTFASAGFASSNHLSGELFKMMAGVDIVHVPYKGGSAAVTDLIAGNVSFYFGTMPSSLPHVRTGRLRALAVTSAKRSAAVPEIPTMAEAALPGFEQSASHGLLLPAETPPAVVNKLNAEVVRVLRLPDLIEKFAAQGAGTVGSTPEEFTAYLKSEIAKYARLVKAAKIRVD